MRLLLISLLLLATSVLLAVPGAPTAAGERAGLSFVVSTFDTSDEGWRVVGDAEGFTPTYVSSGGNPGGYVSAEDEVTGGTWYFSAPAAFLGDKSNAFGQNLTFDLRQDQFDSQFDEDDVVLAGGGVELTFDTGSNPGSNWTAYTVSLFNAGWTNAGTDSPASQADMLAALGDLTSLRIRGEYRDGPDTGDLDNVVLGVGAPECPEASGFGGVYTDLLPGPLFIPDSVGGGLGEAIDCISINDAGTIQDLDLNLDISHTWVGDLRIMLFHENTFTSLTVFSRPLESTGSCNSDDIDVTLDDEARLFAGDQCESVPPAIRGNLRPASALRAFDGEPISGNWRIEILDFAAGDVGDLNGWALIFNSEAPLGDVGCDGAVTSVDAALILQQVAGLIIELACQTNGDVNGDGRVDSIDAAIVLQFIAGFIDDL